MSTIINERVNRWMEAADSPPFSTMEKQIDFLNQQLFRDYEPTLGPHPDFERRFEEWLLQVTDEADQQVLFELVTNLLYIGTQQMAALYRTAYNANVARWLIEEDGLMLESPDLSERLAEGVQSTWFSALSDGSSVARFQRLIRLEKAPIRTDWASISEVSGATEVSRVMATHGFTRIVIIEDFVGSGDQLGGILEKVVSLAPGIPILAIPIIGAPSGLRAGYELAAKHKDLTFSPVLSLPEQAQVYPTGVDGEPELFERVRRVVRRLEGQIRGQNSGPWPGAFGLRNTGALVVLSANCPDNTLPMIHRRSNTWNPLFPRADREG